MALLAFPSPPPFSPLPSQITNASLKVTLASQTKPYFNRPSSLRLQVTPCSRRHLLSLACLSAHRDSGSGLPAEPEPDPAESSKEARFDLKLPRRNLIVQFTCNACGERTKRIVNRLAYERGTIFVQCAGCLVNHKLVDNLGLVVEYDLRDDAQGSGVSS